MRICVGVLLGMALTALFGAWHSFDAAANSLVLLTASEKVAAGPVFVDTGSELAAPAARYESALSTTNQLDEQSVAHLTGDPYFRANWTPSHEWPPFAASQTELDERFPRVDERYFHANWTSVYRRRWPQLVPLPAAIAATSTTLITRQLLREGCATRRRIACNEDAMGAASLYGFRSLQRGLLHADATGNDAAVDGVVAASMPAVKSRRRGHFPKGVLLTHKARKSASNLPAVAGLAVQWSPPAAASVDGVWCCRDFRSLQRAEVCAKVASASSTAATANNFGLLYFVAVWQRVRDAATMVGASLFVSRGSLLFVSRVGRLFNRCDPYDDVDLLGLPEDAARMPMLQVALAVAGFDFLRADGHLYFVLPMS
jgi:hypothetical protein